MGYSVTAHLTRASVEAAALKALPKGCGWRVYRDEGAGLWLIDVHLPGRGEQHPFTQDPFALERLFGARPASPALISFYAAAEALGLSNSAPPAIAALNLRLSAALGQDVLSLASDDDDLDLVCRSTAGSPTSIELQREAHVLWSPESGVQVRSLFSDEDDEEPDLETLEGLDVSVLDPAPRSAMLHGLALKRTNEFTGGRKTLLGLGGDEPVDLPEPVASSGKTGGGLWPFGRKR